MATIITRPGPKGSTVYRAEVRRKGYPRQVKTFPLKRDAVKWARKIEREIDAGTWQDLHDASKIVFDEALERYLSEVSPSKRPATQRRDKLSASHLSSRLGKFSLAQITPARLAKYRDSRLEVVSANSVRIELALVSHLFNVARKEWQLKIDNPVTGIEKPKIPEGRSPTPSQGQLTLLLDTCNESTSELLYPFVVLALHTGARSLEIRSLQWDQINLDEGYIKITSETSKSKRTRLVPMTPLVKSVLLELKVRRDGSDNKHSDGSDLVFPSKAHPTKPRDLHKAFDRAVVKAGMDNLSGLGKFRIHDLRHCCGSALVKSGVDLETTRKILGHRDISTTQKYLHMEHEHMAKSINKIGELGLNGDHTDTDKLSHDE